MRYKLFEIDGRLPGLNKYTRACRAHWSVGSRMKKDVEELIGWEIARCRPKPITEPCALHFVWTEPNARRDYDNITFAKKFVLDAMQECGIIKGDDSRWIIELSDKVEVDKTCKNGKVQVYFTVPGKNKEEVK